MEKPSYAIQAAQSLQLALQMYIEVVEKRKTTPGGGIDLEIEVLKAMSFTPRLNNHEYLIVLGESGVYWGTRHYEGYFTDSLDMISKYLRHP